MSLTIGPPKHFTEVIALSIFIGFISILSTCLSYQVLQCTSHLLFIMLYQHDIIDVMNRYDALQEVPMVQISLDYIMTEEGRVHIILGQNYVLLCFPYECSVFLIFFPE